MHQQVYILWRVEVLLSDSGWVKLVIYDSGDWGNQTEGMPEKNLVVLCQTIWKGLACPMTMLSGFTQNSDVKLNCERYWYVTGMCRQILLLAMW